jgi:ketosteroid isomerase-like protein
MRYLLLLLLAACGSKTPVRDFQPPPPNPELTPSFSAVKDWLGHWRGTHDTVHWTAASGAMYGVWFSGDHFTIHIVDDGEGAGPPDGELRFISIDDGRSYAEVKGLGKKELQAFSHIFGYSMMKIERSPADAEVEAADRAFAADVKARGVDAWVAVFDPQGGMLRKGSRIEGAAIREAMADTLSEGLLAWDPIASGVDGNVGYTVGKATYTPNKAEDPSWASTYITIWRRQPDGSWKVLFDTGRPVNAKM